ncbi:pentapeptide repeat-containing protein [Dyella silvatica]|uniref:pentapeptide repeat-containing protein n=1 Tax=Dyella silvatica TaxID=2992128 RepID=UPI00224E85D8|nr:pentapeptide repeat-containing protein [Dyella silvatica]
MQDIDLAAPDPQLGFIGKYKLSIMLTPRRQYLAGIDKSAVVTFTTAPDQAMVFAVYAVLNADRGDVWILQATPVAGTLALPGGFISIMGGADEVVAMYHSDYRRATQFLAERQGQGARLFHRKANRWLVAKALGDAPTLWLPPSGLFDQGPWQLDLVQGWSPQTMANADLRYVRDLKRVCRPGLSFAGAQLQQADFSGAYLGASNFSNSRCQGTNFFDADMMNADFTGAVIDGAYFHGVDARGAKFPNAIFSKKGFNSGNVGRPTRFDSAILTKAVFDDCDLSKASFTGAKLAGASLKTSTLNGADFSKADLAGARLDGASALRAVFTDAAMTGATLSKAKLGAASFQRATLTKAQFDDAVFVLANESTAMVDFTGATLYQIDFSGCDLRAARIPVRHARSGGSDDPWHVGNPGRLSCRVHGIS